MRHSEERSDEESLFFCARPKRDSSPAGGRGMTISGNFQSQLSENGLNFGVDRDVRLVEAIDSVGRPAHLREMKVAADVVVLVEYAEDALDLSSVDAKIRKRREESKAAREGQIFIDDFAQGHIDFAPDLRENKKSKYDYAASG